jgi:ElaB/YqjD/DUF883 family membrane-anchored ribosome-binding protein
MLEDESSKFDASVGSGKGFGKRMADNVSAAAHTAGEKVDATLSYAESTAHNVRDRMDQFYRKDVRDLKDRGLAYTRSQPLSALLIAAGVGILLGWLSRRGR